MEFNAFQIMNQKNEHECHLLTQQKLNRKLELNAETKGKARTAH